MYKARRNNPVTFSTVETTESSTKGRQPWAIARSYRFKAITTTLSLGAHSKSKCEPEVDGAADFIAVKMSAASKRHDRESIATESDVDLQYEELCLDDDWTLTDQEEDLEATVRTIQARAEASAAGLPPGPGSPVPHQNSVAVEDFLRNFLLQMGMAETLDCFQTEWLEVVQKGLVDTERVSVVPEVYIENQRLYGELKNAQREGDEYRRAAAVAAETLSRAEKARDAQRTLYTRVDRERNKLMDEIRRLKVQCDCFEPEVKRMSEKYQALLRQTMLATLDKKQPGQEGEGKEEADRAKRV